MATDTFWQEVIRTHGRKILFLDTSAILGSLERDNEQFDNFFSSMIGYKFLTSTYVVAETVRRLVKADPKSKFEGPSGEKRFALCRYILKSWLHDNDITVLWIPEQHFIATREHYCSEHSIPCDLTDLMSAMIVRSLEQNQIASSDGHFRQMGLMCIPGDL